MIKVMSLLKRKDGMPLAEFRTWATQEHPKLGMQLQGIRAYRMNVVRDDTPDMPFDAVSEYWFDSKEALDAAFGSDFGQSVAADAIAHCANRVRLLTEETILIP